MDVGCDGSALTALVPQSDPKVVCGTIKLCQPRGSPEGALKFQEPPPAPAQDFAQLSIPLISGVPLLLQPQDAPRAQVPAQPHQHPAVGAWSLLITPLMFWGAAVIPQEPGDLCGDCARLVAAVQVELGAFARSLASRAEKECEGLAPVLAQRVRSQSHLVWGGKFSMG